METYRPGGQIELDPTSSLVGKEQLIYAVLVSKAGFNNPAEAVSMARSIFHCLESLQGKNPHAEDYSNPDGELSSDLVNPDELASSSGISRDLAESILRKLNIMKKE